MSHHPMTGFDERWADPEAYIIGITREIWEERGIEKLHDLYAPNIPVRFPGGSSVGNEAVIASTHATLAEFPDRELLAEDVIWSDDGVGGFLSSHRILSTATHLGSGSFGEATGKSLVFRTIADCAARENVIYDEWLVRDLGAMVRQLGLTPLEFAEAQVAAEGGPQNAVRPVTPATMPDRIYTGKGNDHVAGARYAQMLSEVSGGDLGLVARAWDRAVQVELPGGVTVHGWRPVAQFWADLRSAMPDGNLTVEHLIGCDDAALGERAALRWWFSGSHDGAGLFGDPTGATLDIMGISHAEFGPWGLRREWVLFDEVAVWKQIVLGRS